MWKTLSISIIAIVTSTIVVLADDSESNSNLKSNENTISVESTELCAGPGNRYAGSVTVDPKSGKVFLFGGEENVYEGDNFGGFKFCDQPMVLDLNAKKPEWKNVKIAGDAPNLRAYSPMAADSNARLAYMFGGFVVDKKSGGSVMSNDLWTLNMKKPKWAKLGDSDPKSKVLPPARDAHAIAFDQKTQTLWVYGGLTSFFPLKETGDLWKYDVKKSKWTQIEQDEGAEWPIPRMFPTLHIYKKNKALLLGGSPTKAKDGFHFLWELDLEKGTWEKKASPPENSARMYFDGVWSEIHKRLFYMNGSYIDVHDDIWAYDPETDDWDKAGNTGHKHAYGHVVENPETGTLITFGGLSSRSFQGKHADDKTIKLEFKFEDRK